MMAMAMYPDVQKKAQEEISKVVGPNRLPDFEDLDNIPYVKAVAMEVIRWRPAVPFSIPHATTADDVYNGYHIPANSTVIANIWCILIIPLHKKPSYIIILGPSFMMLSYTLIRMNSSLSDS